MHCRHLGFWVCLGGLAGLNMGCQPAIAPAPSSGPASSLEVTAAPVPANPSALDYTPYDLPESRIHVLTIPPGTTYRIEVALAETLAPLPVLAEDAGAIAAINAGFFDPQNGRTTSYITRQNQLIADPRQNPRLMENPDLEPYLDAILDRSEFRIYDCHGIVQYAIVRHSAAIPASCTMASAVGAGPQLLPTMTGYEEGFLADNSQGDIVRDAVGSRYPNARSAVGIKADGSVVFVMASQRADVEVPTGLSFADLAVFLQELDVISALNLDGGSSSGLFYRGETFYGRLDAEQRPVERPIKSILLVH
ncbi:MAG: phosphodiester glycosidase family protein [Leptolyngbyaceae cyanobacterium]